MCACRSKRKHVEHTNQPKLYHNYCAHTLYNVITMSCIDNTMNYRQVTGYHILSQSRGVQSFSSVKLDLLLVPKLVFLNILAITNVGNHYHHLQN